MFKTLINQCIKLLHFHCFKCAFGFLRKITLTFSGNRGCCVHTHAIPFLFVKTIAKIIAAVWADFFGQGVYQYRIFQSGITS